MPTALLLPSCCCSRSYGRAQAGSCPFARPSQPETSVRPRHLDFIRGSPLELEALVLLVAVVAVAVVAVLMALELVALRGAQNGGGKDGGGGRGGEIGDTNTTQRGR